MQSEGKTFADENTTEDEARKEYQAIAARRVRLGLVLGTVGEKAGISISDDEMQRMLVERARQFPGRETNVFDYYRRNPQALIELRGPLFEQKVIDHIAGQSRLTTRTVSRQELIVAAEDAGAVDHGAAQAGATHEHDAHHDHAHHDDAHHHGHEHDHDIHGEER
jgi:trigger factor